LLHSRAAQYLPAQLVPFMHGAGELRSRWPASEISCHVGLVCDACPIGAKAWCSRNRIVIACRRFVDLARRRARPNRLLSPVPRDCGSAGHTGYERRSHAANREN
jgi:hypothetical protein